MMASEAKRRRILIVEDQRLIAADLERTLERLGYEVAASVDSGEEAVSKAVELRPDLVLMDIRLRGRMDGVASASAIRQRTDLPVVYLTAYADEETIARAKLTSPFGYLVKPFNERELRAAVEIGIYEHETDRLLAEERGRRRAAEELRRLLELLDRATIRLFGSLELPATVREAARIAVPELARWCVLDLADEAGRLVPAAAAHADPDKEPLIERLARAPELACAPALSFLSGKAALHAEVPDVARAAELLGTARTEILAELGVSSLMSVPLTLRGRRLGAMTLVRAAGRYEAADLELAQELAQRVAMAIENARLHEEAKAAVRVRDEFLQVASHELKTPLTPLRLQLDILSRALAASGGRSERLTAKLEMATRQTSRLARLVDSLLDVSRITAGRLSLEIEPFDLTDLVREVAARFRPEAHGAGSELCVRGDVPIQGRWDRMRVDQILSNLVSNAVKYGAGKPIEIEAAVKEASACISVADHGIGLDKEAMDRIFGKFERVASHRHYGGLGLGLFVARQLAEAHGGTITVESQPGAGSTFTVTLPLTEQAGARDAS